MEKLNVAIADDNERMLRLLGAIIESDEELNVVGTAKDGEEAYNVDRKSTRLNSSHMSESRMPSSA